MPPTKQLSMKMLDFVSQLFMPSIGFNATEAYRRAYPKCKTGHQQAGSRMLLNVVVQAEIIKRQAKLAKKVEFTAEKAQELYEEAYNIGKDCKQPAAMNGSVLGMARLCGLDKDAGVKEQVVIVIGPKVIGETPRKVIESEVIDQ